MSHRPATRVKKMQNSPVLPDPRLNTLLSAAPDLRLLTAAADLEHYGRDWTRRWPPAPLAVALPSSVAEVQAVLRWAGAHSIAVVPSGGRTGLSGGAVAAHGELVLSLARMHKVLEFNPVDRTLTVQAGAVLETIHAAARGHGLIYPVDFAARGSATIGGTVATNAGGIRVIRYGNTREWIAGLKVVTADGTLLELNRGLIKNSSGYDLRHLMIGSEGTLGVVVEVTLTLTDPPPPGEVMLLALPSLAALMQVFATFRARLQLDAFEFFDHAAMPHVLAHGAHDPFAQPHPYYVLTEYAAPDETAKAAALEVFATCMDNGWILDGCVSTSEAQARQLWQLREGITESIAHYTPYKNDVSVRVSDIPAFLHQAGELLAREYPQFEVIWFGHIGDGNLHVSILKPAALAQAQAEFIRNCERVTQLLADLLQRFGGSISAEHGIGLVKKPYLESTRSAADITLMRAVRNAFDPQGILNPGKLFDR